MLSARKNAVHKRDTATASGTRLLLWAGVAGPVVFVLNVILGGLITPGYSHVSHAVSELTQRGAPQIVLLSAIFVLSALLMAAFGAGVMIVWRGRNRRVYWGGVLIMAYAVMAVLLATIFPQDPIGEPLTFAGLMHLILVGISALAIVGAIVQIGCGLDAGGWTSRGFRLYSILSILAMLVGGVATPVLVSFGVEALGVTERLTQLGYLQWFVVFAQRALDDSRVQAG